MPGGDYDGVGDRHIADYDYEVGADADYNTYHMHTSYLSILVHRRIIVYEKYTKKLSELATK